MAVATTHFRSCAAARFVRRVSRLQPGKYVLTLTVKKDAAFWTIQEMGRVEG